MKWKYNPKTGRMEQEKRTGVDVTARQGGIMVEDFGRNIRFLINYGTGSISHCFGCKQEDIHLFSEADAAKIAERVRRLGAGRGIPDTMFRSETFSQKHRNCNMNTNKNTSYVLTSDSFLKKESVSSNYKGYIEERLNECMFESERIVESNDTDSANANFTELHVKKSPKVKGYFKMISIRYPKRVSDIKKMCIEYINTYIDSCVNVAMKMKDDQVELEKSVHSLASDLNFKAEGASTNNTEKRADNLKGVLFLTGDKALKDKLNAILEKIRIRAKKSESLQEWAKLMVEQSKIIANEIVFKETNKLIKDETKREKSESDFNNEKRNAEAEHKRNETDTEKKIKEAEQKEKEQEKADEEQKKEEELNNKEKEKENKVMGGDIEQAAEEVDDKALDNAGKVDAEKDFNTEPVTDDKISTEKENEDGEKTQLPQLIGEWTAKYGEPDKKVYDLYNKAIEDKAKKNDGEYSNEEKQFLFGAIWADNTNVDKGMIPAPEYIAYICANSKTLLQALNKEQLTDSEYVELDSYAINDLDGDKLLKESGVISDLNAFYTRAGKEWKYFFSKKYKEESEKEEETKDNKDNEGETKGENGETNGENGETKGEQPNESRRYILSSSDFIKESASRR